MTTIAPAIPSVHPRFDPDELRDDDEGCTEGMSDEECDKLCTRAAKAMGVCKCRRRKDD